MSEEDVEDALDFEAAREAMKESGTVPWEKVKRAPKRYVMVAEAGAFGAHAPGEVSPPSSEKE